MAADCDSTRRARGTSASASAAKPDTIASMRSRTGCSFCTRSLDDAPPPPAPPCPPIPAASSIFSMTSGITDCWTPAWSIIRRAESSRVPGSAGAPSRSATSGRPSSARISGTRSTTYSTNASTSADSGSSCRPAVQSVHRSDVDATRAARPTRDASSTAGKASATPRAPSTSTVLSSGPRNPSMRSTSSIRMPHQATRASAPPSESASAARAVKRPRRSMSAAASQARRGFGSCGASAMIGFTLSSLGSRGAGPSESPRSGFILTTIARGRPHGPRLRRRARPAAGRARPPPSRRSTTRPSPQPSPCPR